MVEIDHVQMWCRGGSHDLSNLRLLCRLHNQSFAALELGEKYMLEVHMEDNFVQATSCAALPSHRSVRMQRAVAVQALPG